MALTYQERISELISGLSNADGLQETLRALIDRIVLQPSPETDKLDIFLEGALSGLLTLALKSKVRDVKASPKREAVDNIDELVLVAGVGFEPTTFRL